MPEIPKMLTSQKNQIFKIIEAEGLEPANFSWISIGGLKDLTIYKLKYLSGEYFFEFDSYDNGLWSYEFSPAEDKIRERYQYPVSWKNELTQVTVWLRYLKKEFQEPDLWQEMEKYRTTISLTPTEHLTNEPISGSEADHIARDLSLLADKIEQQFKLTDEQNQFVRTKLNYLAEAAKRQRSADWVHTSIGVFATIAMGLAMAPDQTRELWQLIKSLLGGFIHLIGP